MTVSGGCGNSNFDKDKLDVLATTGGAYGSILEVECALGVCKVSAGGILRLLDELDAFLSEIDASGRGKRLMGLKNLYKCELRGGMRPPSDGGDRGRLL